MTYCTYCGQPMDNGVLRCPNCHTLETEIKQEIVEEELKVKSDRFLDELFQSLRWEQILWRIAGILGFVMTIEPLFRGIGMLRNYDDALLHTFGWIYLVLAGLNVGVSVVVFFVFPGKVTRCIQTMDDDIRITVERYTRATPIVMSFIFSPVTAIPTIISTVRINNNKNLIEYIIARQEACRNDNG